MTRPVLQSSPNGKPAPDYGPEALSGLVIAQCVLTVEGTAEECKIIKSLSPTSDRAILAWLGGCRWSPVTVEGKPIRVRYAFNLNFERHAPKSPEGIKL
jgi:periplasmic protein TonB